MHDLKIIQIKKEDIDLQKKFISSYQEVFAGEPYFEKWELEIVQSMLNKWFSEENTCVLVAIKDNNLIGFIVGIPLINKVDVSELFSENDMNPNDYYYNAELGVLEKYRGNGIAKKLISDLMQISFKYGFKKSCLRTKKDDSMSKPVYEKFGFLEIPNLIQTVKNTGIEGDVEYQNIFLEKNNQ